MKLRLLFEAPLGAMVVDPSIADAASKLRADPRGEYTDSRGMRLYGDYKSPAFIDADTKILGNKKVRAELKRILDKSKYNFNILFLDKMFWDEAEKYESELDKVGFGKDYNDIRPNNGEIRNYPDREESFPNAIALVKRALTDERAKRLAEAGDIQGLHRHLGFDDRGVYEPEMAGANEARLNDNLKSSINLAITGSTDDPYTAWMILHQFGEAWGFNNRQWFSAINPFWGNEARKDYIGSMFKTTSYANYPPVNKVGDIVTFGSNNRGLLTRLIALAKELNPNYKGENNGCKPIMSDDEFNTWKNSVESGRAYVAGGSLLEHYNDQVIGELKSIIYDGIMSQLCMSRGAKMSQTADLAEFMAEYLWHTDKNGNHRIRRNPDLMRVEGQQGRALVTRYLGEEAEQLVERYYGKIEQICENALKKAVGTITFHPGSKVIRV